MNKIYQIKAVRGMADILPDEIPVWADIEFSARQLFSIFGYSEIRTPILEETALFNRSIGETTDIVQKEMYTFQDKAKRNLSLRPEATACVVRAYLQHHLDKKSTLTRLFYIGPMFRSERPQAGRNRQFHQIGIEALGPDSPYLDAEAILLLEMFLKNQKIEDFQIKLNSLGCSEDKTKLGRGLAKQLASKVSLLCDDCKLRIDRNVFRVLDCKKDTCRRVIGMLAAANDTLCEKCRRHYDVLKEALDALNVIYTEDKFLVRGLDYYTSTVFEVTHKALGAQDAIAAGGRYDNLIKELGGPNIPAVGFAIGIERLIKAKKEEGCQLSHGYQTKVFIATVGEAAYREGFKLLQKLRAEGVCCEIDYLSRSLKAQLKFASKEGFPYVVILGDDELEKGEVILRDMAKSQQENFKIGEIRQRLKKLITCIEIQ